MEWSQHYWFSLLFLLCAVILGTSGHGRLIDPASRVSCWRYNFPTCAQQSRYTELDTDNQWNCGGWSYQWDSQNGACGVCGDKADGPYKSEAGGPYATGTIVRSFSKGSTIKVSVEITMEHKGYIEFKLCPVNDMTIRATQECFDMNPLPRSDGKGFKTDIITTKVYAVEVVLPPNLTCKQCVMQWHYVGGNNWGDCGNGTQGLGCGKQETFRACADITITSDGNPDTTTPVTTPQICKALRKCDKKKGSCIPKSMTCAGKVIKKGCKTSDCKCCVPPKPCKQTSKCKSKKGASCISAGLQCRGKVLKKLCKGKKCQCCQIVNTTPPPEVTTTPDGNGGGSCQSGSYKPTPSDCSSFFQCVNGEWVSQRCSSGLHWNQNSNTCDWPQNVKCEISDKLIP